MGKDRETLEFSIFTRRIYPGGNMDVHKKHAKIIRRGLQGIPTFWI